MSQASEFRDKIEAILLPDERSWYKAAKKLLSTDPTAAEVHQLRRVWAYIAASLNGTGENTALFLQTCGPSQRASIPATINNVIVWLQPLHLAIARGHPENIATLLHFSSNGPIAGYTIRATDVLLLCKTVGIPIPKTEIFERAINYAAKKGYKAACAGLLQATIASPRWAIDPNQIIAAYPSIRDSQSELLTLPAANGFLTKLATAYLQQELQKNKVR